MKIKLSMKDKYTAEVEMTMSFHKPDESIERTISGLVTAKSKLRPSCEAVQFIERAIAMLSEWPDEGTFTNSISEINIDL